mmetsp:Transcript_21203/g.50363  ORF Transcript_21203/g.50363 Transcript_21203/m.50363 type:complete len:235 (-) Transcript_21203:281-985(-)
MNRSRRRCWVGLGCRVLPRHRSPIPVLHGRLHPRSRLVSIRMTPLPPFWILPRRHRNRFLLLDRRHRGRCSVRPPPHHSRIRFLVRDRRHLSRCSVRSPPSHHPRVRFRFLRDGSKPGAHHGSVGRWFGLLLPPRPPCRRCSARRLGLRPRHHHHHRHQSRFRERQRLPDRNSSPPRCLLLSRCRRSRASFRRCRPRIPRSQSRAVVGLRRSRVGCPRHPCSSGSPPRQPRVRF